MSEQEATTELAEGYLTDLVTGQPKKETDVEKIRQNFERTLIEEYFYTAEDIGVDVQLRGHNARRKFGLVVYNADQERSQGSIRIVIDIADPNKKQTDKKGGVEDLRSALIACENTEFGVWTNGVDRIVIQKVRKRFESELSEVTDFPRRGESEILTKSRSNLRIATGSNLLYAFQRCHNFIHGNQGGSKEGIFWELLKIIFAKIQDERNERQEPEFAIRSLEERRTSEGHRQVKQRIDDLYRQVKASYRDIFKEAGDDIRFDPMVVSYCVAQLEKYDFLHSPVDVKGTAYETIVGPTLEGHKGEFFTPRPVVKMAVKMLDPKPGDRILDPACGTGGFIVMALNYIAEKLRREESARWTNPNRPDEDESKALKARIQDCAKDIFGLDFNSNLVKTARMNMVMNNDGQGGLFPAHSLKNPEEWDGEARVRVPLGSMDIVLTNPPFGTDIKIEGDEILTQYELARRWEKIDGRWRMKSGLAPTPTEPEILFIERCWQFLKPGTGRMAVVLPDGILNNPNTEFVRHWIMQNCEVLASVDLPVETFLPRTGTQTSVLVLRRLSPEEKLNQQISGEIREYPIFMAVARKVGKDRRGNTIYRRDPEGTEVRKRELYRPVSSAQVVDYPPQIEPDGRVVDDDLPKIAQLYHEFSKRRDSGAIEYDR